MPGCDPEKHEDKGDGKSCKCNGCIDGYHKDENNNEICVINADCDKKCAPGKCISPSICTKCNIKERFGPNGTGDCEGCLPD